MMSNTDRTELKGQSDNITPSVNLDEVLADFKVPTQAVGALRQLALTGGELVDETTAGFFIGIVNGDLVMKGQARLPIKKLIAFIVSLLIVGLVYWAVIHPWLSRIQISLK